MSTTLQRPTLTPMQADMLDKIRAYQKANGLAPTLQELAVAAGVSKNTVNDHTRALKRKGYLTIAPHVARGIRLTVGCCPCCGREMVGAGEVARG